jgi:uncharacterized protein YndB with AHSA1/START domain
MAITFEMEETVDATPERIFEVMTDLEAAEQWMPGLVGLEELTDTDFGQGTEWRETRKMFGREAVEYFEVTECDRPNRLGLYVDGSRGSSGSGEYRFVYELTPADDKTRLVLSGEISGMGFIGNIIGKIFSGSFKKAMRKDLQAMIAYAERPPEAAAV